MIGRGMRWGIVSGFRWRTLGWFKRDGHIYVSWLLATTRSYHRRNDPGVQLLYAFAMPLSQKDCSRKSSAPALGTSLVTPAAYMQAALACQRTSRSVGGLGGISFNDNGSHGHSWCCWAMPIGHGPG